MADDIANPIAELFDDPAAHQDERYRLDRRDLKARRRANLSLPIRDVPNLDPAEERELIQRTLARDEQGHRVWRMVGSDAWLANHKLAIHHHKSALAMAAEYHGPDRKNTQTVGVLGSYEDRIAAALLGWSLAKARHDMSGALNTSARTWMRNHVREECRLARKRGDSSDTRADRVAY